MLQQYTQMNIQLNQDLWQIVKLYAAYAFYLQIRLRPYWCVRLSERNSQKQLALNI